jgi:hypothetical protein
MSEYFRRELPPGELIVDPTWKTFKNFGVQWSKLIAWSWGEFTLPSLGTDQENDLKRNFKELLQKQALNRDIYLKCDTRNPNDPTQDFALDRVVEFSKQIKNLLLGETDSGGADPGLTLSKVLEAYTGQPLMTTGDADLKKLFKESFNVGVITDSFIGRIIYARDKDATSPAKDKYILELAYPPQPQFSDSTFILKDLEDWLTTKDNNPIRYKAPPSAYIPWSGC